MNSSPAASPARWALTLKNPSMKMRICISSILVIVASCSYGQELDQFKRTPYKLTIAVDKRTVYEEDLLAAPYVLPNKTIQLYPGETVFVEVELENGIITSLKAVKEIKDSSKTVSISFTQTAKNRTHELMMLKVVNPFKQKLVYDATMFLMMQKKWVKTDVYPVQPGLIGYETWTDIITSIGLGHWKLDNM